MKVNPPREVFRMVRRSGGEILVGITRYDEERGGRVLELTAFWPGKTGYDEIDDEVEAHRQRTLTPKSSR